MTPSRYTKCEQSKGQLYVELLPRLCSGEIELPDDPLLVKQLAALERRTRSGGKDVIDHPPGGHDDLANVIAGVAVVAATKVFVCEALGNVNNANSRRFHVQSTRDPF